MDIFEQLIPSLRHLDPEGDLDSAHDAVVSLLRDFTMDEIIAQPALLVCATRRKAVDRIRKRDRWNNLIGMPDAAASSPEPVSREPDPQDVCEARERDVCVLRAVDRLSPFLRDATKHCIWDGIEVKALAQTLATPLHTVYSRLREARNALRQDKTLSAYEPVPR